MLTACTCRAVGRSEHLGGHVVIQGLLKEKVLPLFQPNSREAIAPIVPTVLMAPVVDILVNCHTLIYGRPIEVVARDGPPF